MTTYLPPIENPSSPIMRLVYSMTRRQYGKVLTPLTVFAVRLPSAFGTFYGKVSALDKKLVLPKETAMLVRQQVARLNICTFCSDIGRWHAEHMFKMSGVKFDALEQYENSPLFTEAQRAALDYATELTRDKRVEPKTFECLRHFFSEREICEIVWLVASEHLYNITNIGLNIHSDGLCAISPAKVAAVS